MTRLFSMEEGLWLFVILGMAIGIAWNAASSWWVFALWVFGLFYFFILLGVVLRLCRRVLAWIAFAPLTLIVRLFRPGAATMFGSARWATDAEARRWTHNNGEIYLGTKRDVFGREVPLTTDGRTHVLCLGMNRSGKTSGLVVPALLSLRQSVVCWDWKSELHTISAGFREHGLGQKVVRFAPAETGSARFNFLSAVNLGTDGEVTDCQTIAQTLGEGDGPARGESKHWVESAMEVIAALILFRLYVAREEGKPGEGSLGDVVAALSDPTCPLPELWAAMAAYQHSYISNVGQAQLNREAREESGVISTARRILQPWTNPAICRNTSVCDFTLDELTDGDRPMSLYLCARANVAEVMAPVMRLFLAVLANRLQSRDLRTPVKHRVVLMLDEFSSIGFCSAIKNAAPRLAGFGATMVICVQSLKSLREYYGTTHTFLANAGTKIAFAVGELEDAEFISKSLGTATESWRTRQDSSSYSSGLQRSTSTNLGRQFAGRPLRTVDEVLSADPDQVFIWETGVRPTCVPRIKYWLRPVFAAREACTAENATVAANDNPFPVEPIPRAVKAAALAALIVLPLGGWGGWHLVAATAPPVVAEATAARDNVTALATPALAAVGYLPSAPSTFHAAPLPTKNVAFRDANGKPIANAPVEVFAPGDTTTPVITGHTSELPVAGNFSFTPDRPGSWTVVAHNGSEVIRAVVAGPATTQFRQY